MFYIFSSKIFKSLMSTFVLNVALPNRNFGDAIEIQDLRGIRVSNVSSPLEPKSWRRSCIQYILYIYRLSLLPPPKFLYVVDPMEYRFILRGRMRWRVALTLLHLLTPNGIILISTFLVISIDNRTDFGNLGKRLCKENSLDNSYRLDMDKILLITFQGQN